MTHTGVLAFLLLLWPVSALAQTPALPADTQAAARPTSQDRFQDFVHAAVLSPTPYVLTLGGGVLDQFGNMPEEWTGGSGFAKRTGARWGMGFISDSVGHSAAAVIHHRVLYDRCTCRGGWSRIKHAMGRAFVSVHEDGHHVPNWSLWIAKFSAAGVANAWYPESYQKDDIVREGGVGIVVSGGLNILNEFGPELMKLVPFK